jgi:hypothetical protein
MTPLKSTRAEDTTFDRRRGAARSGGSEAEHPTRRRQDRPDSPPRSAQPAARKHAVDEPQKRRSTRDGRQPLVVYMQPASIKALKIAALEHDTTASAIVAEAVSTWLRNQGRRKTK